MYHHRINAQNVEKVLFGLFLWSTVQSGRVQVTEFFKTKNGRGKLKTFLHCEAAHPNLTLHLLCRSEGAISVRSAMQSDYMGICVLRTLNSIILHASSCDVMTNDVMSNFL